MKKQAIILLLILAGFTSAYAQTFDAKDLDGTWERNDGVRLSIDGTAVFAEGSIALIFAVGNSGWPESVIKYYSKFKNIKHKGNNTWTANNYAYSRSSKSFIADGAATLVMSDDKSYFKCAGLVYTRKSLIH